VICGYEEVAGADVAVVDVEYLMDCVDGEYGLVDDPY